MTQITKLSFTEEMKGYVAFNETDYDRGFRQGKSENNFIMFHLTITVNDVDAFVDRPAHDTEDVIGYVECAALGGQLPVEKARFNLFVDGQDTTQKLMLYRLYFSDKDGRKLLLSGFKDVRDDPGFDVWKDTTTLFVKIVEQTAETDADSLEAEGQYPPESIVASGIINIYFFDFLKQLTTFHVEGPSLGARNNARLRFCKLFFGKLLDVFGPQIPTSENS